MKILIIAFPRSGTSLTYRIFKTHKDVENMYFESLILWKHWKKNVEQVFPSFGNNKICGEKIIYEKEYIGKKKEIKYVEYCDRWDKKFGNKSKIIQIVRHPYDQWNSIVIKKYARRRIINNIPMMLNNYFQYVPKIVENILQRENSLSIKYEDLTRNHEKVIEKLYSFCELDLERSNFKERIRPGKTFWYETHGHVVDFDGRFKHIRKEYWKIMNNNIDKVLEVYNQIPGVEYKK